MKKWNILSSKVPSEQEELIAILLTNRGITQKSQTKEFLHPVINSVVSENVGIDIAMVKSGVKRVREAMGKNETIVIFGDYDVDGITGTAVLWETLYWNLKYRNVHPYIPHRVNEGYGISEKGIDAVLSEFGEVKLIVTVDNGIVAQDAVRYANAKGIDVIVTDHHTPGNELPEAHSIIHTTQLCGASVALLFALLLEKKLITQDDSRLDLIALATVADLVPLIGPNRALLKYGLEVLRKSERPGICALVKSSGIEQEKIGVYEIGHMLAPRLNAAGRLEHALDSLRLICTKDKIRAEMFAENLNVINKQRQVMTEGMVLAAKNNVVVEETTKIIISASEEYNQGVIGLIASRLTEHYYRPTLVIAKGSEISKGSGRSIKGVNIIELIRSASSYLTEVGGHPMAAGFSLKTEHIEQFSEEISQKARAVVGNDHLQRILTVDCEIPFDLVTEKNYMQIQKLSPFGMSNFEPIFVAHNLKVEDVKKIGKDGSHLRMKLKNDGREVVGIGFGLANGQTIPQVGQFISVVFSLSMNEWNGRRMLQLLMKDYTAASIDPS